MPLQFALSVSLDNRYGSKELNVLLAKLGFACSYDEVSCLLSHLMYFLGMILAWNTYNGSGYTFALTSKCLC